MKNVTQLKDRIKILSIAKNIPHQNLLQNYVMERMLHRITRSQFRNHLILKGGFLVRSMIGIELRTTMDMDLSVIDYGFNEDSIGLMFSEVCDIQIEDGFTFVVKEISTIREKDPYGGYRVKLLACFDTLKITIKIDVTTGDITISNSISYHYSLMFDENQLYILAYNAETILAEKIETILSRGVQNSRARDFYDVYILFKVLNKELNYALLRMAIFAVSENRRSHLALLNSKETINQIKESQNMKLYWDNYKKDSIYASEIEFEETIDALNEVMAIIQTLQ